MTPIVFVHGFMGGSKQWAPQRAAFNGAPLHTVDLPGFGENNHLDALNSIAQCAEWVREDLARNHIAQYNLVGHSMGGMVAQEMLLQEPDRVADLVLYGTGAQGVLPGRFETIETSKQRAQSDGPHATATRICATWFLERESAAAYAACAAIATRSGMQAILAGLDAMNTWNGSAHLASLEKRTLIMWGDGDRTYPWSQTELLWRTIPNASLAVIPECAHAPHLEKPDIFNSVLKDFLSL